MLLHHLVCLSIKDKENLNPDDNLKDNKSSSTVYQSQFFNKSDMKSVVTNNNGNNMNISSNTTIFLYGQFINMCGKWNQLVLSVK